MLSFQFLQGAARVRGCSTLPHRTHPDSHPHPIRHTHRATMVATLQILVLPQPVGLRVCFIKLNLKVTLRGVVARSHSMARPFACSDSLWKEASHVCVACTTIMMQTWNRTLDIECVMMISPSQEYDNSFQPCLQFPALFAQSEVGSKSP